MSFRIYIPTLDRIGKSKQVTLNEFLAKSPYKPVLVCPIREVKYHKKYYPNVIGCSQNQGTAKKGAGSTRQWILENSKASTIFICDDDLYFQRRIDSETTKLQPAMSLKDLIQDCIKVVNSGYIHGGISPRQGNNYCKKAHQDNTRNCGFHFLNREEVIKSGARYDQLEVMEDFYFTLSLLTAGYPNRVLYSYSFNQRDQRGGSIGGCNTYRTSDLQSSSAEKLASRFPEFVKVIEKETKGWSIAAGKRKDVRIQWKKAFESSKSPH